MTDGFRPLKKPIVDLGFGDGADVWAWDAATSAYASTGVKSSGAPTPSPEAAADVLT
jgi:hypothetical protein